MMPRAPSRDLAERLRTDGVETGLANDFPYDDNIGEIERGIALIDKNRKESGLRVVIVGEDLQSITLFQSNYVLYEEICAKKLCGMEESLKIVRREFLVDQRRKRLSERGAETYFRDLFYWHAINNYLSF